MGDTANIPHLALIQLAVLAQGIAQGPVATTTAWPPGLGHPREIVPLNQPAVAHDIVQDGDGFLWIATTSGLLRYDGERMQPVPLPTLGAAPVHALSVDNTGRMWIATGVGYVDVPRRTGGPYTVGFREGRGGVFVRHNGTIRAVLQPNGQARSWVWRMASVADGRVAAATEDGLWLLSANPGAEPERIPLPTAVQADFVATLASDKHGLWIGTASGVWRWRPGQDVVRISPDVVRGLVSNGTDQVWLVAEKSVRRFVGQQETLHIKAPTNIGFRTLMVDPGGGVWLGTDQGLHQLRDGVATRVPEPLPGQTIRAILHDREGNIWISVKGFGVAQLRVPAVRNLGRAEGLPADSVLSLSPKTNGDLWLATSMGLVDWTANGARHVPIELPPDTVSPVRLRNLALQNDGTLWLGWDVLARRDPSGAISTHVARPTLHGKVRAVHVDVHGDLWIGWFEGGVTLYPGGQLDGAKTYHGTQEGLCPGPVEFIRNRPGGGLWIGGRQGLSSFDRSTGKIRCFSAAQTFAGDQILDVAESPPGTTWVVTIGNTGLYRLRDGTATALPPEAPFPARALYAALAMDTGHLWFTSTRGVFRVHNSELEARLAGTATLAPYHVETSAGMRTTDCQATFAPEIVPWMAGGVLVATTLGLSAIAAPESLPPANTAALFDGFFVDGIDERLAAGGTITVPPGARQVEIRFAAPTFVAGKRPRLEYQIGGSRSDWTVADPTGQVNLGRLAPRSYEFRVRVQGQRTPPATLPFVVQGPWWQRGWVWLAGAALLTLIALVVHRLRLRQIARRFQILTDERARIARELHDNLAQQFLGIGYQLAAMKKRLSPSDERLMALVDDARGMIKDVQADTRRVLWSLRSGIEPDTLARALTQLANDTRKHLGAEVTVRISGTPPPSGVLNFELPRIAQEAVTNAIRHGNARHITICVTIDNTGVTLEITDDGTGMPPGGAGGDGFGMQGMRERATRCGGSLTFDKAASAGVVLRMHVPPDHIPGVGETAPREVQ